MGAYHLLCITSLYLKNFQAKKHESVNFYTKKTETLAEKIDFWKMPNTKLAILNKIIICHRKAR